MHLINFVSARLDERERIAKAAMVRGGAEWSAYDREQPGWWKDDVDTELLIGGKSVGHFTAEYGGALVAEHVADNQPSFVLADVAAKRQILNLAYSKCGTDSAYADGWDDAALWAVKALALPYTSHPDYDETWRP